MKADLSPNERLANFYDSMIDDLIEDRINVDDMTKDRATRLCDALPQKMLEEFTKRLVFTGGSKDKEFGPILKAERRIKTVMRPVDPSQQHSVEEDEFGQDAATHDFLENTETPGTNKAEE